MAITYSYEQGRWVSDDPSDPPFDPQTGSTTQPSDGAQTGTTPPPSTSTSTPPPSEDFSAFLTDLQNKYNVPWTANDSPTDLARLKEYQAGIDRFRALQADPNTDWEKESAKGAISFPSQLEDFKKALERQYEQRGANTDGQDDGFSHDPATRAAQMAAAGVSGAGGGGGSSNQQTQTAGNYAQMFGAPPAPFSETYQQIARPAYLQGEYQAPARPDYLQGPYTPPVWTDQFVAPTVADLQNEPGYLARLDAAQRGFERSAAAKGSVLSGGFVGRTLPRELQTQASNEYANVYNRAYDTYQQRYGEFKDMANNLGAARTTNENAYNSDVTNAYNARNLNETQYGVDVTNNRNAYTTRYNAYQDLIANNRNAELDWWARQRDIGQFGLNASLGGRPPVYS